MATFELNSGMFNQSPAPDAAGRGTAERFERTQPAPGPGASPEAEAAESAALDFRPAPVKQESIFTLKIYDHCRNQDCLDEEEIGRARVAFDQQIDGKHYKEGEIVEAPRKTASVDITELRIKRVTVNKRANTFKRGYWDIDIKYVFEYTLAFLEADGREIGCLAALSTFDRKVTLFGSSGSDVVIATDLINFGSGSPTLSAEPFVLVEAKAIPLAAKLKRRGRRGDGTDDRRGGEEVAVTIGLFTIVKTFRLVTLIVESRGFSIPRECTDFSPINVCDYFDRMPFPMSVFAPPQRREFESGISGDIPRESGIAPEEAAEEVQINA